ncbi:MAG: alanine--tRNA ligase [Vicingaceae bacterium]
MDAAQIRKTFLEFFENKGHRIVPSSPMVVKNDPTLMFTNAGMNQFKDIFLGNKQVDDKRVADTQKCLRVSGKHNDLEEVGVDTYHHTMFEMLGNWSFGDYFKKETIDWAVELLLDVYKIDKDRLYVTYFDGDTSDKLEADVNTHELWKHHFDQDRILGFGRKDNFWEMGETGPCGPCSEIHCDIRNDEDRATIDARELVNKGHPQVVEIWNLVFIEFNRNKDQSLTALPKKHVDTGMGLERLAMVLQGKQSNYDTDIFMVLIRAFEKLLSDHSYSHSSNKEDIAFRVVVDHIRAVSIAIAEGQLPSNTGAGYVIRRILRRAIRYAYSFLGVRESLIHKLVPHLVTSLGKVFPELKSQADLVEKVIKEEEESFLRTLEKGIERFEKYLEEHPGADVIDGQFAFELYDTFGFPVDLTELMAQEKGILNGVNQAGFKAELGKQKDRSRAAGKIDAGDWIVLVEDEVEEFVGYDQTSTDVRITKYRQVSQKGKDLFQLVFNITPFYAESGGQVGDTGYIQSQGERIEILDTKKENELIIHISDTLPTDPSLDFKAFVDVNRRERIKKNHSATHLLHHALRTLLGSHVEQKGSLVHPDYLRFDFSHFEKVSEKDLSRIESMVNEGIRHGIALEEMRSVPLPQAKKMGAMALFGEKYGDVVRVIKFGDSVELCGGTHVGNIAEIGHFKIQSEGSISAGIRRIEAITGDAADNFLSEELDTLEQLRQLLKNPADVKSGLKKLLDEHQALQKELEAMKKERSRDMAGDLESKFEDIGAVKALISTVDLPGGEIKDLVFSLVKKHSNSMIALASSQGGKAVLTIGLGPDAMKAGLSARKLISESAPLISGGGGGQDNFATAGGKNPGGIDAALEKIREMISDF